MTVIPSTREHILRAGAQPSPEDVIQAGVAWWGFGRGWLFCKPTTLPLEVKSEILSSPTKVGRGTRCSFA